MEIGSGMKQVLDQCMGHMDTQLARDVIAAMKSKGYGNTLLSMVEEMRALPGDDAQMATARNLALYAGMIGAIVSAERKAGRLNTLDQVRIISDLGAISFAFIMVQEL